MHHFEMEVEKVSVKISLFPNIGCRMWQGCGWDVDRGSRAGIGAEAEEHGLGQRNRGKKGMGQVYRGRDRGTRTWTGLKHRGQSGGTKGWIKG